MVRWERQAIADGVVDVSAPLSGLGPRLRAKRTRFVLGRRTSSVEYSHFEDCTFTGVFPSGFYWQGCELERCRFEGYLDGNGFGPRDPSDGGLVVGCDFSRCRVTGCDFYCGAPSENVLPPWPAFAVQGPREVAAVLRRSGRWPKAALWHLDTWTLALQPVWMLEDAEAVAGSTGVSVEALRKALDGVEGVTIVTGARPAERASVSAGPAEKSSPAKRLPVKPPKNGRKTRIVRH